MDFNCMSKSFYVVTYRHTLVDVTNGKSRRDIIVKSSLTRFASLKATKRTKNMEFGGCAYHNCSRHNSVSFLACVVYDTLRESGPWLHGTILHGSHCCSHARRTGLLHEDVVYTVRQYQLAIQSRKHFTYFPCKYVKLNFSAE